MWTVVYIKNYYDLRILDIDFQTDRYLYLMKKSELVTKHISVNLPLYELLMSLKIS